MLEPVEMLVLICYLDMIERINPISSGFIDLPKMEVRQSSFSSGLTAQKTSVVVNVLAAFQAAQLLRAINSALDVPEVAKLKSSPPTEIRNRQEQEKQLARIFVAKGYSQKAIHELSKKNLLHLLVQDLIIRDRESFVSSLIFFGTDTGVNFGAVQPTYRGTNHENFLIDKSIKDSNNKNSDQRKFSGLGATRIFRVSSLATLPNNTFPNTKMVIIGGGPAGIMATRGLIRLGFDSRNITVLDAKGEYKGIWNQKNVFGGSKNNPFQFDFLGDKLESAPGAGDSVNEFLNSLINGKNMHLGESLPDPVKASVLAVVPGDLNHKVVFKADDGSIKVLDAPILINCIGNGKPLTPNREGYMTTTAPEHAGIRWQTIINERTAERYRNKRLVFIGLGNSTAEMLIQIRALNKKGYNIDYKVITHYPKEAILNPENEVEVEGKKYKVFRDIKVPNLTKWEGDLPDAREAYFEALKEGKIISDVKKWDMRDGVFKCEGKKVLEFDCEQLFTLIGYGHDADTLKLMGMYVTDPYLGSIAYDYDGEIQRSPGLLGRERVYPGYFGLGSILKSPTNPNAVVMPGIMHRMYDQLFSIIVRAQEYELSLR